MKAASFNPPPTPHIRPRTTAVTHKMSSIRYVAVTAFVIALVASSAAASTSRRENTASAKTSEETFAGQRALEELSHTPDTRERDGKPDSDTPEGRWFGWFGWGHKYPYYYSYSYPHYNYYSNYWCGTPYYGGGSHGGYNGGYNSYYKSASGETKDEMKSRQVLPRDQLAKQAMQRQTIAAKRVPASTCLEWLGVTLNEISEAPNEVAVVNDGCCFPSGCALAPSAGCFAQDGQPCCVPDSERKETC